LQKSQASPEKAVQTEVESPSVILAVDDTPENLDVVKGVLAATHTVRVAINGMIALKIAVKQKPDLILLDINMPGMDGYEVCRELKNDPATRSIPVIFLTAELDQASRQKGLELGAVDYVTKPIDPQILLASVNRHL
jgi:putative two-component system response regulator